MSYRYNVWVVARPRSTASLSYLDWQDFGCFEHLKLARHEAKMWIAKRMLNGSPHTDLAIYQATFSFTRSYLVRTMNTYEGFIEPTDYKLKEVVTLSEEEAERLDKKHGLSKEEEE